MRTLGSHCWWLSVEISSELYHIMLYHPDQSLRTIHLVYLGRYLLSFPDYPGSWYSLKRNAHTFSSHFAVTIQLAQPIWLILVYSDLIFFTGIDCHQSHGIFMKWVFFASDENFVRIISLVTWNGNSKNKNKFYIRTALITMFLDYYGADG